MTIQTQITSMSFRAFAFAQPIQANSRDYGFDFDEDELGRELLAQLHENISLQSFPKVDEDALGKDFQPFLS